MKKILFFVVAMFAAFSAIASDQFYVITRDGFAESTPTDNVYNPQIDEFMGVNDLVSEFVKLKKEVEALKGNQWNGNDGNYSSVEEKESLDGHDYVDLGLPSGLKWATMNVGAQSITDFGTYFAWGETAPAPRIDYSEANCKVNDESSSSMKSRGVIANDELTAKYDAATQNWGKNWEMPSESQFYELMVNCRWTWTTLDGVKGYKVESKVPGNTNWIFLPAGGYYDGTSSKSVGSGGHYWTSTCYCKPESVDASDWIELSYSLDFDSDNVAPYYFDHRYRGFCVRPVCKSEYSGPDTPESPSTPSTPEAPTRGYVDGYEYVDLGLPSGLKWATMNVGAKTKTDYGTFYAYGEVSPAPNNDYSDKNSIIYEKGSIYNFQSSLSTLKKKGILDINDNLTPEYDAATQNWGNNWRMPTKSEFEELKDYCKWTWADVNGVKGFKVESKQAGNSNWIFLPAGGSYENTSYDGEGTTGAWWCSTFTEEYPKGPYTFWINNSDDLWSAQMGVNTSGRAFFGQNVRPVVKMFPIYMIMKDGSVVVYESTDVDSISFVKNNSYKIVEFNKLANEIVNLKKELEAFKSDGSSELEIPTTPDTCITGYIDSIAYVDLGLPSGLKWSTSNLGHYYYSGSRDLDLYYSGSGDYYSESRVDEDGHWRLPTGGEFSELVNYCTWTWTTLGGVQGYKVESKVTGNTNWIFLPAAGYTDDSLDYTFLNVGAYWTSTDAFHFDSSSRSLDRRYVLGGNIKLSIRLVTK